MATLDPQFAAEFSADGQEVLMFRWEAFDFAAHQVHVSCPKCFALSKHPILQTMIGVTCPCSFRAPIAFHAEASQMFRDWAAKNMRLEDGVVREHKLYAGLPKLESVKDWLPKLTAPQSVKQTEFMQDFKSTATVVANPHLPADYKLKIADLAEARKRLEAVGEDVSKGKLGFKLPSGDEFEDITRAGDEFRRYGRIKSREKLQGLHPVGSWEQELVYILSAHAGERGDDEGAVDTLKRIIRERDELVSASARQIPTRT